MAVETTLTAAKGVTATLLHDTTCMAIIHMALLTQLRRSMGKHGFIYAAMGVMAVSTIFSDRRMLP